MSFSSNLKAYRTVGMFIAGSVTVKVMQKPHTVKHVVVVESVLTEEHYFNSWKDAEAKYLELEAHNAYQNHQSKSSI